jgi:acyl-CoA synthetase (AMP-forming)/AMP-acid ligase II
LLSEAHAAIDGLDTLSLAFYVGDKLRQSDVDMLHQLAPQARVVNYFGSTETQRAVSYYEAKPPGGDGRAKEVLPIGRGTPDVQLLLVNAAGHLAGIGEAAEILVRSPHVALGYLEDEELTRARFITNPFGSSSADKAYRTGDLGCYQPDGTVEVTGRADFQVKIRGFRIELGEIEAVLATHDAVRDAVVVGQPLGPDGATVLCAYVTGPTTMDQEAVRQWLRQRLPEYMIPTYVSCLDRLPMTPNHKVDRKALPQPVVHEVKQTAAETPLERRVSAVWCEVLGVPTIGRDTNFFDAGGNSLLVARLHARLQTQLERELALVSFFQYPTIRAFAAFLSGAQPDTSSEERGVTRGLDRRAAMSRRLRARRGRS